MSRFLTLAGYGLRLIPVIFLAIFFFFPLLTIFEHSLRPDDVWDFSGFIKITTSEYYRETIIFTVYQAVLSTGLTIGLALPGAYVFTRFRFPGKSLLMSLSTLPFVLPTVVVAAAFSAFIGRRGLLNQSLMDVFDLRRPPIQLEETLILILIVHVFYNYAIALRIITGYWQNQSLKLEEAARVLGSRGWRLWWYIRLPLLAPAILAATVLVFIFTFTSFGVVLILGGIRFATLEVQIYYNTLYLPDEALAAALSIVQISIMFLMMLVYTRLQRRITTPDVENQQNIARPAKTWHERLFVGGNLTLMIVLLFTPLLALVIRSVTTGQEGISLIHYLALNENPRDSILYTAPLVAFANSLFFAAITTVAALFLGVLSAYLIAGRGRFSRWLDPIFMLPLATSAVTLGFGFTLALDEPPLNLRTSWVLIPIAHTLVALPFVLRSVLPAIRSIPAQYLETAALLQASPFARWRHIELPLISRSLIVGATFAFTVSMGEFGASLFIFRPDTPTMPIVIFRLLGQPGSTNYGQAMAMSVLLMLVCGMSFVAIERIRTAGVGEF